MAEFFPKAHRWAVTTCGSCPNAHLLLYDENDRPMADATVSPAQVSTLVNALTKAHAEARRDNLRKQQEGLNMTMQWEMLHPKMTMDHLGFLPGFLSEHDPRPAREQINANYAHGGGWSPLPGWTKVREYCIKYPGDPMLRPLAKTKLRDEVIVFYDHEILAIFQPDGSFEASRVD